jgi:hypothetical protein
MCETINTRNAQQGLIFRGPSVRSPCVKQTLPLLSSGLLQFRNPEETERTESQSPRFRCGYGPNKMQTTKIQTKTKTQTSTD